MERFAIVSVSNKEGLIEFVQGLVNLGYKILSTGGTANYLSQAGIEIFPISKYIGQKEILDGRVKTLHPKIHGGILARRDNLKDLEELKTEGISPIDLVVVNLYPFREQIEQAKQESDEPSLVEFIDIGGPTMIRAAAKNCKFVLPICDYRDYAIVLQKLREEGEVDLEFRRSLAAKVFLMMSAYDGAIGNYFANNERVKGVNNFNTLDSILLREESSLRYGENPHQKAKFYLSDGQTKHWHQLQGKELSYNNLLDMYATLDLFLDVYTNKKQAECAVIIKHSNPCGVALADNSLEAFTKARACDPVSAFGGIVAVSGILDRKLAESISEGFVELLLVREATEEAKEVFLKKKNLRLILCDFDAYLIKRQQGAVTYRNYFGEWLVQEMDRKVTIPEASQAVCGTLTSEVLEDAKLANIVCKHVKSNAIVLVKNGAAIGIGAGQMNRVDSAKISLLRAKLNGHNVSGSVAASDAFLPFADTLEVLAEGGVSVLVQPGGSIKDNEVIDAAKRLEVTMLMTGSRHFRH
jgi:phosphoribosylaminoimidazolecarboxamide formyltransferase / IMP cyclohydrolase